MGQQGAVMMRSAGFAPVLLVSMFLAPGLPGAEPAKGKAKPKAAPKEASVTDLKLEVEALQTLFQLKATPEQLQLLKGLAKDTADTPRDRKARLSDELKQDLIDLHTALVDASDEEDIDKLNEQFDQRYETEKPDLDEDWEITPAARKKTPEVARLFKAPQLAHFLGDEVEIDPLDQLVAAMAQVRGMPRKQWLEHRDEVADQVAQMLAGIDKDKYERVSDQVVAFLSRVRVLKDAEFKDKRDELEKAAAKIVANPDPLEVLRNYRDYRIAKLLANPRLAAAVSARLGK